MHGRTWGKLVAAVGLASVGVAAPATDVVHAATINVTTTADQDNGATGGVSLREAIITANGTVASDVIVLPAGTYVLSICGSGENAAATGDLDVTQDLTIRGPATGTATIEQTCDDRVIDGRLLGSLTIERVTIRGGHAQGGFGSGDGGGVSMPFGGTLTILESIIRDNQSGDGGAGQAGNGGGIFQSNTGTLHIERSTITNNSLGTGWSGAPGGLAGGGGIAVRNNGATDATGSVTIIDSTISDNVGGVGGAGGGGAWLRSLDITLTDVVVSGNSIPSDPTGRASADGAGISVPVAVLPTDEELALTITGGEFSGNTIAAPANAGASGIGVFGGHGGGLYVDADGGSVDIDGTTFDANAAGDGGTQLSGVGSGGNGGNVYVTGYTTSSIAQLSVTVTDAQILNGVAGTSTGRSGGSGGGVYVVAGSFDLGSTISITDTTFQGNDAGSGTPGGGGGGLYAYSSTSNSPGSITITGSTFRSNDAGDGIAASTGADGGYGGGAWLYVDNGDISTPRVSIGGSTFDANTAGSGGTGTGGLGGFAGNGGGAIIQVANSTVTTSTFTGNSAGRGGNGQTSGRSGGDGGGLDVTGSRVTVTGSTISGNASGDGGDGVTQFGSTGGEGGGASLAITDEATVAGTTVSGNSTGDGGNGPSGAGTGGPGGGIHADLPTADLTVTDSVISGNSTGDGGSSTGGGAGAGGPGGGLAARGSGAVVDIDDSRFDDNTTGDGGGGPTALNARGGIGGGIFMQDSGTGGSLSLARSSVADNTTGDGGDASGGDQPGALGGDGAGLWVSLGAGNPAANGRITIDSTSITGNVTGGGGAGGPDGADGDSNPGISPTGGYGAGAMLTTGTGASAQTSIVNSTIAGNITGRAVGAGSRGDGGGVYLKAPHRLVALDHATIAGNTARNGDNVLSETAITAARSVIADPDPGTNNAAENCNFANGAGSITSLGDNAEGEGDTCDFVPGNDLIDLDELLGPLQDNGGPGLTRAPRILGPSAGALIDHVPSAACPITVDQRGVARPQGAGCDIGAVESNPSITAKDDVFRVGPSTFIDFVANDVPTNASLDDTMVMLVRQPDQGALLRLTDGRWRYIAPQASGASTDFEYRVCLGVTDAYCDTATVTLIPDATSRFVSLNPARVFDTRPGETPPGPKGTIPAGGTIDVQITGVAGVPSSGVSAIALNVTATETGAPGFVTAYATGTSQPPTSNLNIAGPGTTIPNFVIVPVGAGGKVTFFSLQETHLLADVAGYFTESGISTSASNAGSKAGRLVPIDPVRVFDTRPGEPAPGPKGFVADGATLDVQIAGAAGVPPSGAAAVVMNLTLTESGAPGFVTAFPKGTAKPLASNLNVTGPFQTVANLVIVPIGADGMISLYSFGGGHLLGDVTGYITGTSASAALDGLFVPIEPDRVFDTRPGESPPGPKGFVAADATITAQFSGVAGIPSTGVGAVALNVTATESGGAGHITVWPDGIAQPTASTLNLTGPGQTRPNAAVIPLGDGGRLRFYAFGGAHLLTDTFGWFLG